MTDVLHPAIVAHLAGTFLQATVVQAFIVHEKALVEADTPSLFVDKDIASTPVCRNFPLEKTGSIIEIVDHKIQRQVFLSGQWVLPALSVTVAAVRSSFL